MQYRAVDRSRLSAGSSASRHHSANNMTEGHHMGNIPNDQVERTPPTLSRQESTPNRSVKERLGVTNLTIPGSSSGSKERRSALERISEQNPPAVAARLSPSFESGRLQRAEDIINEMQVQSSERIPVVQRLGAPRVESKRSKSIPVASQLKAS
ncbi:hypothetical protein Bca52824_020646 [Brassica carinata]|uniref:Uncharacterized protein n=1 Tax=Brassica carinata TaxID=52824 RepID=A0A8X7VU17_BRACI|nr:hypothetical protein Bca52824_020646 [Brassica carinata]